MINSFAKNKYYSQYGEDGIVEEILSRINQKVSIDKWCSEFGAWDGVYLSNTCYFIKEKKYKAVLIEGDKKRVEDLKKNFQSEDVQKINRFVSFDGENSLDSIFSETKIPINFDFLSIDVDGVDYYIFESLKKYKPKIICIEFNPSIPNSVDYVQPKDMKLKYGNSAKALLRLAHKKNYSLAASTNCNLIFVHNNYFKYIGTSEPTLNKINPRGIQEICIFSAYDGTILSNSEFIRLGWHGLEVPIKTKLQFLPKFMRKFFGDYGLLRRLFFIIYVTIRLPKLIIKNKKNALKILSDIFKKK
jgi:hypothetical protein